MLSPATAHPAHTAGSLSDVYARVRSESEALVVPLSAEDCQVQSMPDASPAKWHLAHVSWFFEQFVLTSDSGYSPFHGKFSYLFNSYYYSVGEMHLRPSRGLLTRPSLEEILAYRAHVDEAMRQLMAERTDDAGLAALVTLGLNHEQQHQELLLMDLKHLLSCNPLKPAYQTDSAPDASSGPATQFISHPGGVHEIGADGSTFCFDNETPRHRVWVDPFEMADRPVTNAEYRAFIEDGGYRDTELWLADGWATIQREGWERPLYWEPDLDREFTLHGIQPIDPAAPVCHLSYFEADAYARWADARLPNEAEWEIMSADGPTTVDPGRPQSLQPRAGSCGEVWEWTASGYQPYPGFRPLGGSLGEYNGKFMVSQMVLRGAACVTPTGHARPSYRNFYYPHQRWQFAGFRLARNAG